MGDLGSIPGLGWEDPLEEGTAVWYSCLENPTDRGAWGRKVSDMTERLHFHFQLVMMLLLLLFLITT